MADFSGLADDIRQRRGTDTIIVFDSASDLPKVTFEALDEFVGRFGLSGIGDQWKEISREPAVSLVKDVLSRDLAYRIQIIPPVEALQLAERFAALFGPDARFFTNTDYSVGSSNWGWMPLTGATFDAGILGVDASTIGVLVVQDED